MALGTMNREGSLARSSQMDSRSVRGSPADCGARSKTPPGTPKKAGKVVGVRVLMLDDSVTLFQVQVNLITPSLAFLQLPSWLSALHSISLTPHYTPVFPACPHQSLSQTKHTQSHTL